MEHVSTFEPVYLRRLNTFLAMVVVCLALYIFVWPFMPMLSWWTHHHVPGISHKVQTTIPATEPIPQQNTLVIPTLNMREKVFEGSTQQTLDKGVWHLPDNSSPDKGGNTIMAGHRFTYDGQAVFYNLDKVALADNITLYWQSKRYDYVVTGINEVPPTDKILVAQTVDPTLTLYTCTPLWTAKHRLVITAKLVEAP